MREASTIMSKGTSKLAAAKAKLAVLDKDTEKLNKEVQKATKAWQKALDKADAQRSKVGALEPAKDPQESDIAPGEPA